TSDGINMPAGSLTISGTSVIRSAGSGNGAYPDVNPSMVVGGTSKIGTLGFGFIAPGGQLDITNNGLIVQASNDLSKRVLIQTIAGETATIFNATSGTFHNIISSTATTNTAYGLVVVDNADLNADLALSGGSTKFGGLTVDSNSILITQA